MSNRRSLSVNLLSTVFGALAITLASCEGAPAKRFGGGDTGGQPGVTGGSDGASGGRPGATGGDDGASGGQVATTGGASATGGAGTTTGGMVGTGSGGRPNTGGVTGTGGRPGTGGAATGGAASGGAGTGGRVGTGGAPATGGAPGTGGANASCDTYAADYQAELPNAKACNTLTGLTIPQCQTAAPAGLGCSASCTIYVQDDTKLTELRKRWNAANCDSTIRLCPLIACTEFKPGNCYASTSSTKAQCQPTPK